MNKGKLKYATIIGLTVAVLLSASFAVAGPGGWGRGMGMGYGGGGPGMGMGHGGYPYAASLSPEQSQKLQALQEAFLKEITPIQSQLFTKKSELRLLWSQANPDQEQIMAKQAEINSLQQQLQEIATQHQFQARAIIAGQ